MVFPHWKIRINTENNQKLANSILRVPFDTLYLRLAWVTSLYSLEVFISFVAVSMNSLTDHVFIKWEVFKYEETEILQAAR